MGNFKNKEKAKDIAKYRESEFGEIRDINGCCYMSALDMAQWKDEQYKTAYVVTRSDLHYDEVEKVFFDEKKAEEYCKTFNDDENNYHRDITKIEVSL